MDPLDEVRCERDEWRGRALAAEREVKRLKELLGYAEEAIMGEYQRANAHSASEQS
jgi:hypothetical protein